MTQIVNPTNLDVLNFFARASEMLGADKTVSHRGGLQILQWLVERHDSKSDPNGATLIPYVELVADWLRSMKNAPLDPLGITKIAGAILREAMEKITPKAIKEHKDKYRLPLWPDLRDTTLEYFDLRDLNLQTASMEGAKLKYALLSGTDMGFVEGLTGSQIEEATWEIDGGGGTPTILPNYLINDPDVQDWFRKPPFKWKY